MLASSTTIIVNQDCMALRHYNGKKGLMYKIVSFYVGAHYTNDKNREI